MPGDPAGRVGLTWRSPRGPRRGLTAHLADDRLGLDGFRSLEATRLAWPAWPRPPEPLRAPPIGSTSCPACGSTTRRFAATSAGPPLEWRGTAMLTRSKPPSRPPPGRAIRAGQATLDEMLADSAKQTDRMGYFGRLHIGRSLGSGSVEGLAGVRGRWLKVAGRGWCAGHLDGMAALIANAGNPEWAGLCGKPAL